MSLRRLASTLLLLPLPVSAVAGAQQPAVRLRIEAGRPAGRVSPTLYGLMTEEINHAFDGGLYPEMIRDRAFMDTTYGPHGWVLAEHGDAQASMVVDPGGGPSAALSRSLRVTVQRASQASPAGVANGGYWGMAVRAGEDYQCSFYARAEPGFHGRLIARLVSDRTGRVLAESPVAAIAPAWGRYQVILHAQDGAQGTAENHFELLADAPGVFRLSLVSVFPPTYHARPGGLRPDLMDLLAAMHPAFLRLPGGNYLEGNRPSERFEWKKTIGPWVDRPTHMSPWGYHSSDGMGLLEFLEWCEDLQMQPVLAVYAGYSLAGEHVAPGTDLEPYVQDALDEIEYVSGDADTKWGAERARDGHAAPFALTYVEIGNEDWFDRSHSYDARYAQFYKAIKARFPHLQLIATAPVKGVRPDVIDDHFYRSAAEFFSDTAHYDHADRGGPRIFVGEWATREGSPTPNMGAALGDAAWMTGLERNSDLVIMASYAPLLTNVNPGALQWDTDLIGYDAVHSYGSPSYHAQVLFAAHLGSEILHDTIRGGGPRFFASATREPGSGIIHVKLVNASSTPQTVELQLDGLKSVEPDASVFTLRGATPEDTNSIADPTHIVPVEGTLRDASPDFTHAMPPYSIQVLDLHSR